jgi:hypothetical protein
MNIGRTHALTLRTGPLMNGSNPVSYFDFRNKLRNSQKRAFLPAFLITEAEIVISNSADDNR